MAKLTAKSALTGAALVLALAGCAGTASRESTGEFIDDSVITTKVKTAILNEPSLKVGQIQVETFKGTVQLSGFVDSREDVSTAERLARGVRGVRTVRNDLAVR
jgi:osmotically-inducible protein OsmY